jgi:hypothetical protein
MACYPLKPANPLKFPLFPTLRNAWLRVGQHGHSVSVSQPFAICPQKVLQTPGHVAQLFAKKFLSACFFSV